MSRVNILEIIDATAPETVEVLIRDDGKVVWINVDGICRFRACRIQHLEVTDNRPNKEESYSQLAEDEKPLDNTDGIA